MNFEIASFSSLSGTQPITWQVEYPRKGTTDIAVSEIFISQKDLVAIVPLAMVSHAVLMALASYHKQCPCMLPLFQVITAVTLCISDSIFLYLGSGNITFY